MNPQVKKQLLDILKAVLGAAIAAGIAELARQLGGFQFSAEAHAASLLGALTGIKLRR